jgi:hypothetical protein
MNLRELAEKDLGRTLEGDWSLPVNLIDPDGVRYNGLRGQVLFDIVRVNPETGEEVTVPTPVVSLRRSSLVRIPLPGENWIVETPGAPSETAPMVQRVISPTRPPEGGASIGFIRIYLQDVEQSAAPV